MIKQRAVIAKLKTDDGWFEIVGPIGTEVWIEVNSFMVRIFTRKREVAEFKALVVRQAVENETWIPAELLEYKSDFVVGS